MHIRSFDGFETIILNRGTIRASIAIFGTRTLAVVGAPIEWVINLESGVIDEAIILGQRDDIVQNDCSIIGPVQTGFDDDKQAPIAAPTELHETGRPSDFMWSWDSIKSLMTMRPAAVEQPRFDEFQPEYFG